MRNGELVLCIDGVRKKFCRHLRRSMYYGAVDILRSVLGSPLRTDVLRAEEFWAVQDVSFELRQGESIGLIGANGSGKSTLLRLVAGIYEPDVGRITTHGRVSALIALGAGFHPLLTGRENIYLNGAILGMSRREIDENFEAIVEFADIGTFLDAPVKTYSSGMHVRLGFAIAIHSNPDLLLVDEVLAVGDAGFQKKCFEKVRALLDKGTAMVFVSHAMSTVERLCTTGLLLSQGRASFTGPVAECVQHYFTELCGEQQTRGLAARPIGVGDVQFSDVRVYQAGGDPADATIEFGQDFIIEFRYAFREKRSENNQVRVWIRTYDGRDVQRIVFQEGGWERGGRQDRERSRPLGTTGTIRIRVLAPRLFPQSFVLDLAVTPVDMDVHLGGLANAAVFTIVPPSSNPRNLEFGNMTITEFDYDVTVS